MSGKTRTPPPGPPPPAHAARTATGVQPSRSFEANTRRHPAESRRLHVDELVSTAGGAFQARDPERHVLSRPSGVYNFVRVEGATRNQAATFISARAPHATLAAGRPVLYAGTASFNSGSLAWWSNYSGTYQPNAEFNRQAALPTDKFVPWQKLQMGGIGLQRGMLSDHRATTLPKAENARPAIPAAKGDSGAAKGEGDRHVPAQETGSSEKTRPSPPCRKSPTAY